MSQITYEITANVEPEFAAEYERYMVDRHIPDLMATEQFASAVIGRSGEGRYRIRYEAKNREALDAYLRDHAPRLREHFYQTFPTGVELSREEWETIADFG
jgi:hypothetical protein